MMATGPSHWELALWRREQQFVTSRRGEEHLVEVHAAALPARAEHEVAVIRGPERENVIGRVRRDPGPRTMFGLVGPDVHVVAGSRVQIPVQIPEHGEPPAVVRKRRAL